MSSRTPKIVQAILETPTSGLIELAKDWKGKTDPAFAVCRGAACSMIATLRRFPDYKFGRDSCYYVNELGQMVFFLPLALYPEFDSALETMYVAGDFNGWQAGVGQEAWALVPGRIAGEAALVWTGDPGQFSSGQRFKFVTNQHRWLPVQALAPNAERDGSGNLNYVYDADRTGRHLYSYELAGALDLSESWGVAWEEGDAKSEVPLRLGAFFFELATDWPLGAIVNGTETTFRLFAPRGKQVTLLVCDDLATQDRPHRFELQRRAESGGSWQGAWEVTMEQNLQGWFYWYSVDGPRDIFGTFDPAHRVLDPYALATVHRDGPGIVMDRAALGQGDRTFKAPRWQDLVIVEAHVRDLAANAPVEAEPEERLGFTGLRKWVEAPGFYLDRLGINAVELQPVQEFDNKTTEEYHWGYMTNNFFAPESSYALAAAKGSAVRELQELVAAFHRRGLAVILDVVYNHVGEPAHLMFVDKLYYFEADSAGNLANWSGCGNDLRCGSAMSRRLIVDSLVHLVETYGIDGFRFDLAELIGTPVLKEIEKRLKQVNPHVILIAEPWSFRGHIAGELRDTGFASWNDGYRNFLKDYVRGGSSREQFEYFLKGSPWHFAKWPAQTVNYCESHDDRTWIDVITENQDGNGMSPTGDDRRRTHLMAAVLFSSIGIPMISAGQDFLRSKQGVNNTYQRGDLNALDYRRPYRFPGTHSYFAGWIAFRLSEEGGLLRHFSRASEGFFQFYFAPDSIAAAVVYNADHSLGAARLLFAINPSGSDVSIELPGKVIRGEWSQLADGERFYGVQARSAGQPVEASLFLPPLGCGLWRCEN